MLLTEIEKKFNNLKFTESFEDINKLIKENTNNKKSFVKILLTKANLKLKLFNYNDFFEIIELLDQNYSSFLNNESFFKLKLVYFSLKNETEEFQNTCKKLKLITGITNKESLDLMYLFNTRNYSEYLSKYNNLNDNHKVNQNFYCAQAKLFSINYDEDFEVILKTYKESINLFDIENIESKFDHFIVYLDLSNFIFHMLSLGVNRDHFMDEIKNIKLHFSLLIEELNNFDNQISNQILNCYLLILGYSEDNNLFLDLSEKNISDLRINVYILYCVKKGILNDDIVLKKFLENKNKNHPILDFYLTTLYDKSEYNKILEFIANSSLKSSMLEIVEHYYYLALIELDRSITKEDYELLEEKKDSSILFLSLLIKYQIKINAFDSNNLLDFQNRLIHEKITLTTLLDSIKIHFSINDYNFPLKLLDKYKTIFTNLIFEIIKLFTSNKELNYNTFNIFIKNIQTQQGIDIFSNTVKIHIFKMYFNYDDISNGIQFLNSCNIDKIINQKLAAFILQKLLLKKQEVKFFKEAKYMVNYLEENLSKLSISQFSIFLRYYVNSDQLDLCARYINRYFLSIDISNLNSDMKYLNDIYFSMLLNQNFKNNDIDNWLILKDNNQYIKSVEYMNPENLKFFGFTSIDKEYELKQLIACEEFEKKSIAHHILNMYVNEYPGVLKTISISEENPSAIIDEIIKISEEFPTINYLDEYLEGKNYTSLHNVTNGNYLKYFEVIKSFIESNKGFNVTCNDVPSKKLITVSSIFTAYHLGFLKDIVQFENIFIQEDVINKFEKTINDSNNGSIIEKGEYTQNISELRNKSKEELGELKEHFKEIYYTLLKIPAERVIEDMEVKIPITEIQNYSLDFIKLLGDSNYNALMISFNSNYQIITEDIGLSKFFNNFDKFIKPGNTVSVFLNNISFIKYKEISDILEKYKFKNRLNLNFLCNELRTLFLIKQYSEEDLLKYEELRLLIEFLKTNNILGMTTEFLESMIHNDILKNPYQASIINRILLSNINLIKNIQNKIKLNLSPNKQF